MRPVPSIVLAAVLLAGGLAGCLTPTALDPAAAGPGAVRAALPTAPSPFTHLVCEGDAVVPLDGERDAACNFIASADAGPGTEVHIAVNPLDPLNLVGGSKDFTLGEDARCGKHNVWSGVYWSKDGGRSWTHDLLPGHPGDDRKTALSAYACGSDPVLAFGPDGTLYYAGIYYTDDPNDKPPVPQLGVFGFGGTINASLAVTRSLDGGETWEDPVLLRAIEGDALLDKEWMAVDPASGAVYVSYIDTSDGDIKVQRSDDRGLTWTEPVVVVTSGRDGPWTKQFGQIGVTPDGVVHYVYWAVRENGDVTGIYHKRSEDRGETWSDPSTVAFFYPVFDLEFTHKYRIVPMPALAVDAQTGALHVAYPDRATPRSQPPVHTNLNVYVVSSTDGGATWSAPAQVNDDGLGPRSPTNGQWMPAIAVGPDSVVHATWLDYRDDPTGQAARVYYAHSTDGGKTWSKNAAVSDVAFDGTGGYHQSGGGTIGDYMGLAVSPLGVHPFWSDTRHGRNDVFAAIIPAATDA